MRGFSEFGSSLVCVFAVFVERSLIPSIGFLGSSYRTAAAFQITRAIANQVFNERGPYFPLEVVLTAPDFSVRFTFSKTDTP